MPNWVPFTFVCHIGLNSSLMRRKMEFEAELHSFKNVRILLSVFSSLDANESFSISISR